MSLKKWVSFTKEILVAFLGLCFLCSGKTPVWIKTQIQEDLVYLISNPVTTSNLELYFDQLSKNGYQALYCEIRSNTLACKKISNATDEIRTRSIYQYFKSLSKKVTLPDTTFILLTDDGQTESFPFPIFAFAKHKEAKNVILFPDFEMLSEVLKSNKNHTPLHEKLSLNYPWHSKIEKAFFRGASTGNYNPVLPDFGNDRLKAVLLSCQYPEFIDATFSQIFQPAIQDMLNKLNKPTDSASIENHYQYKYLLDIDGNSCTYSRCRWILLSNSTLFKMTSPNEQWYYRALKPWVHFVPIRQDLSDFLEQLQWLKKNDNVAHKIAKQGQELGKEIFSRECVDMYIVQLLKSYARYVKDK